MNWGLTLSGASAVILLALGFELALLGLYLTSLTAVQRSSGTIAVLFVPTLYTLVLGVFGAAMLVLLLLKPVRQYFANA